MTEADIHNPDTLSRIVMLTFGTMDHGGPYWCYVAIKPSKYKEFRELMTGMSYNMQQFEHDNYGEVIVSGEGERPPAEISKKVADMYNMPVSALFKDSNPDKTIHAQFEKLANEAKQL